jgi:formylglycine-generating enzyme
VPNVAPRSRSSLAMSLLAVMLFLTVGSDVAFAAPRPAAGTIAIPAGTYRPLYGSFADPAIRVAAFRIDRDPVTRGDFVAFVRSAPQWRRSVVRSAAPDLSVYLADWNGDLNPGSGEALRRPVTGVSLGAAKAYCAARGKRLPTLAEWEYVAAASEERRDAARNPAFIQRLVSLYAARPRPLPPVERGFTNVYGVRGLHGLAWEWVDDEHAAHASHGPSRHHDMSCAGAAIGAIDPNNYPAFLRFAIRAGLTGQTTLETLGFRCAA